MLVQGSFCDCDEIIMEKKKKKKTKKIVGTRITSKNSSLFEVKITLELIQFLLTNNDTFLLPT